MLRFAPTLQVLTVAELTTYAEPGNVPDRRVRCPRCATASGLRLVGMHPLAAVWCPECGTAFHHCDVTADSIAQAFPGERPAWESTLGEGLPAGAVKQFPGLPAVLESLGGLHRGSTTAPWRLPDRPNVRLPETEGQLARINAMIEAFHTGVADGDANLILMVPATRRELGVVQRATFEVDPLPVDHIALRDITIDLVARHGQLRATLDLPRIRRVVAQWSHGADTIMWATHWLRARDTSHVRPDEDHQLLWRARRTNRQVAASWANDTNARDGGPPDEPILLPVTARELAVLRAATVPGPDTVGMFIADWTQRADAVDNTDPTHLRELVEQHATGADWAAQDFPHREMVDTST